MIGFILALFTCGVITRIMQDLGHNFWPPPQALFNPDLTPEAYKKMITAYLGTAPLGALLWVPFSYAAASLVAGVVAAKITRGLVVPLLLGTLFTAFTAGMLVGIKHPTWMWPLMLAAFIPFFYLGARLTLARLALKIDEHEKTSSDT